MLLNFMILRNLYLVSSYTNLQLSKTCDCKHASLELQRIEIKDKLYLGIEIQPLPPQLLDYFVKNTK